MNSELLGLSNYQFFNKHVCQKHLDKYQLDERGNRRKDGYPCLFSAKEIKHGEPLPDGTIEISGSQLSVVYDPPHLLKGIRNNLLSKDMIFKGRIASWKDIQMVYEADCQLGHTKMNKKLTDHHIYGQKMKVSLAAQTLSAITSGMLKYTALFKTTVFGEEVSETMEKHNRRS